MTPSYSTLRILRALLDDGSGQHYGLELSRRAAVGVGALYPALGRLEADGWVTSKWEDVDESVEGRRRRRYYQLTPLGERAACQLLADAVKALQVPAPAASRTRLAPT